MFGTFNPARLTEYPLSPLTVAFTGIIDFTSSADFAISVGAAYLPASTALVFSLSRVEILSGAGTCTTALTVKIGNNATFDNLIASSQPLSAAVINAAIAGTKPSSNSPSFLGGTPASPIPLVPLSSGLYVGKVVTPASGTGFALTGRFYLACFPIDTTP